MGGDKQFRMRQTPASPGQARREFAFWLLDFILKNKNHFIRRLSPRIKPEIATGPIVDKSDCKRYNSVNHFPLFR